MTALHKRIKFKKDTTEYFHLNFAMTAHPYFPELDWLLLNYHLKKQADLHSIEIQALVMMTSHIHILFKSTKATENYFTAALFKELKINFPEESLVEPITNMAQYLNSYKYIYRNPVEAKITQKCEDYRFSSLHGLLGKGEILTPVIDPLCVTQNPLKILNWLNNNFESRLYGFKNSFSTVGQ